MKNRFLIAGILAAAVFVVSVVLILRAGKRVAEAPPVRSPSDPKAAVQIEPSAEGAATSESAQKSDPAGGSTTRAPAAAGEIRGRVVDEASRGVAGARVLIARDAGVDSTDNAAWSGEPQVTDAQGAFALGGLEFVPYRVRVAAPGYLDGEAAGILPGEDLEVRLLRQEPIACKLEERREAGTNPLVHHGLRLSIEDPAWSLSLESDAQGHLAVTGISQDDFEAARREQRLDVLVPGYATTYLTVDPGGEGYKITAEPGVTVEGVVYDGTTNKTLPGAKVHADNGYEVTADERGAFRISGVSDDLTAYAAGYAPETKGIDADDEETVRVEFRLSPGLILRGKVLDASGKPLPGVRVSVAVDALDLDSSSDALEGRLIDLLASTTNATGSYELAGLPVEALDLPGDVTFELRPPGVSKGIEEEIEIEADTGEVLHDFTLELQAELPGVVEDANGSGVAKAAIYVESSESGFTASSGSDAQGHFVLLSIPAGSYRLRVEREGRLVHTMSFDAPAKSLTVRLEGTKVVQGTVRVEGTGEPLEGMMISLLAGPGAGLPIVPASKSDAAGKFTIEGVPPGSFILVARPPAGEPLYSRLVREHRTPITVEGAGWNGEITYPVPPTGEVSLTFVIAAKDGTVAPATGELQVAVTSFKPADGNATAASRAAPVSVPDARDGFRARWRAGDYRIRCTLSSEGSPIVRDESLTVPTGGTVERTVQLARP